VHTRPGTPTMLSQMSVLNHLARATGRDDAVASPNGSIDLKRYRGPHSQICRTMQDWSKQEAVSPARAANISVRRSTLLQSPARAGYTERMRQIFGDARRGPLELHCSPNHLYPQLPNISRKASPSPVRLRSRNRTHEQDTTNFLQPHYLASLSHSTKLSVTEAATDTACANRPHPSERSSGSWSDDSRYIVTTSRTQSESLIIPLNERVHHWLSDVSDTEVERSAQGDGEEVWRLTPPTKQCSRGSALLHSFFKTERDKTPSLSSPQKGRRMLSSSNRSRSSDPFMCNANTSYAPLLANHQKDIHTLQSREPPKSPSMSCSSSFEANRLSSQLDVVEEGDVQLSPLSPNVCVERGPSRYQSIPKSRDMMTPCKGRLPLHFRAPRQQENVVMGQGDGNRDDRLLTPRSNRMSTTFRRQQKVISEARRE
jgi:hypothetical protein